MPELLALVAILACGLFAGAAIYINLAEHPARLSCGTELAATEFVPSYQRAAVMQVVLAVTATLAGTMRGWLGGGAIWFVASALIFAVIPFTLIAILPTNSRLLDPSRDRSSPETRGLLEKWGRLHAVRSLLSLVAAVLFIWAALRAPAPTSSSAHEFAVAASRGWQSAGVHVTAGRAVTVAYVAGTIRDQETSIGDANGTDYVCGAPDCCEPVPDSRRSALLARVGTQIVTIGNGATFTPQADGPLELRINDCDEGLSDNSGALAIRVASE